MIGADSQDAIPALTALHLNCLLFSQFLVNMVFGQTMTSGGLIDGIGKPKNKALNRSTHRNDCSIVCLIIFWH